MLSSCSIDRVASRVDLAFATALFLAEARVTRGFALVKVGARRLRFFLWFSASSSSRSCGEIR